MKYLTIIILCLFVMGFSITALAEEPAQIDKPEWKIETDAGEEDMLIKEARELPSTLITDEEERYNVMKKVEELREGYVYDEDLSD